MIDNKDLAVLLMRTNRLSEEVSVQAPDIIVRNELRLIKSSCETILKEKEQVDNISKTLAEIELLWRCFPELRLGQLIANVIKDPYYVEDPELINKLHEFYDRFRKESENENS